MEAEDIALRHEATWTLAAKIVLAVFGFGGVIIFARVLGAAGVGTYYFGLALIMLSTRVSSGIGTAVKKRTSETGSNPGELLWSGTLLHTGFSLVSFLLFMGLSPWLQNYVGGLPEVIVLTTTVATLGWFFLTKNAYEGLGKPSRGVWADALRMIVTFTSQMVFLWYGFDILGLFAGLALGSLVVTIAMYLGTRVTVTPSRTPTFETICVFARWSVPNNVMEDLHDRLDVILLTLIAGSAAAGVYESAKRLTFPGVMVSLSVAEPLVVKVSGLDSTGRYTEVRDSIEQAVAYAGIVAVPILFGSIAIGDSVMLNVYGGEFGGSGLVLIALAVFQVFHVYRFPFRSVTDGIDRPETNFKINTATVIINTAISLVLIWDYGALGVAIATVSTELLRFVYYQYLASEELGGFVVPMALSSQLIAGVGMYIVLRGTLRVPGITVWSVIALISFVSIGGGVYFGLLTLLDAKIRHTVQSTIRNQTII